MKFTLTQYIENALENAVFDKLDDGKFMGKVPMCKGVIVFAPTLRQCENELRSTLEEWILLGLQMRHKLPIIKGLNLNRRPRREQVGAV